MIWWVRLWFGDSLLLQILVRCQCVKGFLCWFVVKTIDLFMLKKNANSRSSLLFPFSHFVLHKHIPFRKITENWNAAVAVTILCTRYYFCVRVTAPVRPSIYIQLNRVASVSHIPTVDNDALIITTIVKRYLYSNSLQLNNSKIPKQIKQTFNTDLTVLVCNGSRFSYCGLGYHTKARTIFIRKLADSRRSD